MRKGHWVDEIDQRDDINRTIGFVYGFVVGILFFGLSFLLIVSVFG